MERHDEGTVNREKKTQQQNSTKENNGLFDIILHSKYSVNKLCNHKQILAL
jgi:hypothetical protein